MHAPLGHEVARQGVIDTVHIVDASPDASESELVTALEAKGYSHLHAEKLCAFVPSAFAWALLRKMGLDSFPSTYIATSLGGDDVQLPIAHEHYFTAALELASHTLAHGWTDEVSKQAFDAVARRSAELNAANQLLEAGKQLRGATLQPLRVLGFSAEWASES